MSAQSPAVVLALLSETRADGPLSRLVLATSVMADLVVLVAYALIAPIATVLIGRQLDLGHTALAIAWELLGSIVFGLVIGIVIARFLRYVKQGGALFALLVCVVVAEIGGRVQLEPVVVMLAAGVWLENFARIDASSLLRGFHASALPVFLVVFALAGNRFDLSELWTIGIPVVLIVLARGAVFYFGSRAACARTHADATVAKYAWTGLVPQAGISIALVSVMRNNFPVLGPRADVLLLTVVGVNQLVAPVLLRISLVRSREAGQRAAPMLAPATRRAT
jgi:Kef-type K+ transport system membrane component KefB